MKQKKREIKQDKVGMNKYQLKMVEMKLLSQI